MTENAASPQGQARTQYHSRIGWMDTDAAGHHHNTAIVRLVEAAEAQLTRDRGLDGYFGFAPRVRFEADFTDRLWFDQEVTVELGVERIGSTSLTFAFEIWGEAFRANPRALAARGRYTVVHLPAGHSTSQPWPAAWRTALAGRSESEQP